MTYVPFRPGTYGPNIIPFAYGSEDAPKHLPGDKALIAAWKAQTGGRVGGGQASTSGFSMTREYLINALRRQAARQGEQQPAASTPSTSRSPSSQRQLPASGGGPQNLSAQWGGSQLGPQPGITWPFRHMFSQGQIERYGMRSPQSMYSYGPTGQVETGTYNWWDPGARMPVFGNRRP